MNDLTLLIFMRGATTFGFACAALYFLRFWTRTGDRLFLLFAVSLSLMAINHIMVTFCETTGEAAYFYLTRLVAFLLIIWAIIDKNRFGGKPMP